MLCGLLFFPSHSWAETTIASGTTVVSSAVTFPVTVQSGGTLSLDTTNVGTTANQITISGTGNGEAATGIPLGAMSSISTVSPDMSQGILAKTVIDGSASVLSTQRLRFQGEVTGGTLSTYAAIGTNPEVHAGYASSFAIKKLIVEQGNFTFNGSNGSANNTSQKHFFYEGIEVKSGGILRLWCQNQLNLYADDEKTTLATITLQNGARFSSKGGTANSFAANLTTATGATGFLAITTNVTMTAGTITGSFQKTNNATFAVGNGVSWEGSLAINQGTVQFQSGSTFSGTLQTATDAGVLDLATGSSVRLTDNSTIYRMGAFSGAMTVAAGKRLTLSGVTTTNTTNPGTLTLEAGSTLAIPNSTATTLNANLALAGNATLNAGNGSTLTTGDVSGDYTLTINNNGLPATSWSAGDIDVGKLQMGNSIGVTADSVAGSVVFYNSHSLTIRENGSLLLGAEGIQKAGTNTVGACNVILQDKTTVGLKSGVSSATANNTDNRGTVDAIFTQLRGATEFTVEAGKTLYWQSPLSGSSGSLTKTGAGTLSLSGSTNTLSQMTLSEGTTVLAGDYTLTNGLTLAEGAVLEADGEVDIAGDFTVNGRLEMTLSMDGGDWWDVTGTTSFGENSSLYIDLTGDLTNGFLPILEAATITGLDTLTVEFSQLAAHYLLPEMYLRNGVWGFQVNSAAVPEPSTGVLFLFGMMAWGYFRVRRGFSGTGWKTSIEG
ncbi:MAG: PEP-CTERM sorting domain-containing protein [Planctomycetia bacterium]|nr:PEP-CTERM sorting domain-containing protein [Planctomycetia bacterium]